MSLRTFHGKVVLVTGGSRGIGEEIALHFAKAGASVMICGTNLQKLKNVNAEIQKLGGISDFIATDVSIAENCEIIVDKTLKRFTKIDILVNNAGVIERNATLETTPEEWRKVMSVNLDGTFYLSRVVLKEMKKLRAGNVVNITSTASVVPHPNASPSYGASKAAITYLTKHFAMEFAKDNIRVNAVQCGPIESKMTGQWSMEYRQTVLENIPLGRLGKPADVAEAVMYLCSNQASFITGASLTLSGGKLMQ